MYYTCNTCNTHGLRVLLRQHMYYTWTTCPTQAIHVLHMHYMSYTSNTCTTHAIHVLHSTILNKTPCPHPTTRPTSFTASWVTFTLCGSPCKQSSNLYQMSISSTIYCTTHVSKSCLQSGRSPPPPPGATHTPHSMSHLSNLHVCTQAGSRPSSAADYLGSMEDCVQSASAAESCLVSAACNPLPRAAFGLE